MFFNQVYGSQQTDVVRACKTICDEIVNRQFADIDSAFNTLSNIAFQTNFSRSNRSIKRAANVLAAYVA
jgi:hypothetical protein